MQESDNILSIVIVSASVAAVAVGATLLLLFVLGLVGLNTYQALEEDAAQRAEAAALEAKAQAKASSSQAKVQQKETVKKEEKPEPVNVNASIEECLQYPDLGGGCEIASMVSVLRALGYDADLVAFAEDYVLKVKGEPDMVQAYAGDPYLDGAAFPPAMAHAGNNFLREQQADWRFVEHKDLSLEKLLEIVRMGRPVLVWTTMFGDFPMHTGESIGDYAWYENEHCVVLYGEAENGNLLIMDPLEGCVERDYVSFNEVYDACGLHAVTITQDDIKEIDKADADKVEAFEAQTSADEAESSEGTE